MPEPSRRLGSAIAGAVLVLVGGLLLLDGRKTGGRLAIKASAVFGGVEIRN